MSILLLKLILTPTLIGIASLAGRRWGPQVSGWLVGLPFTSGPVIFFLALAHGSTFASAVAAGTLTGTISTAAYCVAYAWLALPFPWPIAQVASCAVFGLATVALHFLSLPLPLLYATVLASLVVALLALPRVSAPVGSDAEPLPRWDIPARMVVATAFVVLLTGIAPALGPHLSGLLAPFPLYASILTVFAHHMQGAYAANRVLRGLLVGLFAFATCFLALAALIGHAGIGPAFVIAIILALALQGVSLGILRWEARHHAATKEVLAGRGSSPR